MELISKVSKGSRMDQIYIPKERTDFDIGSYVIISPLEKERLTLKPYFYNIKDIEPIKVDIVKRIFYIMDKLVDDYENIIISGSFLDKGFNFNDIDMILISDKRLNKNYIRRTIENRLKINIHLVLLSNDALIRGLETDPLYSMILSRCVSKKRFIYNVKQRINYKVLDLHLLKSKVLIDNFDYLTGNEKYYLTRNMVAISLFLKNKRINKKNIDKEINRIFNLGNIDKIKQNILNKKKFLEKYKKIYNKTFNKIMDGVKHGSK